ncbi:MAG: PIN domain-containing protein [Chloroflexi bacterium]|nr:PIN domain-containing protein [Chloroflexota bacterium]
MKRLSTELRGVTKLGLDTSPIIYFVEANPVYDALVTEVFKRVRDNKLTGVTSVITLTEVLVQPLRRGAHALQEEYRKLLLQSANFDVRPIDVAVAKRAADLRARYNLRTPDALQIAVARSAGCQAILCNDGQMERVTELRVLVLDQLTL